ncbi:MAG: hypothetical protein WKF40_10405 [Thermoleophilaceae bacterium]
MAFGEESHQHVPDHLLGRLDRPTQIDPQALGQLGYRRGVELRRRGHRPGW